MIDRTPDRPDDLDDKGPADPRTEKLVSWLDHELTPAEAEVVEAEIARDPGTRREARALRKAWDMLDLLPRTEPSADFTHKTLSRLDIPRVSLPGATSVTSAIVPPSGPSPTMPMDIPTGLRKWVPTVALLLAVPLLGGFGWQMREWVFPHPRGVSRVESARGAPEAPEFLETLSRPTWFGQDLPDAAESPAARLVRMQDLYSDWLDRLPAVERQKILEAPTWLERLPTIRRLRDADWLETLSKTQRDQYARETDPARRYELIAQWRIEEEDHRADWEYATRAWKDAPASQLAGVLREEAYRRELLSFAQTLEPRLSSGERETLRAYWPEIDTGPWELFVRRLHNLADRHALWPGTGATRFDELPREWKDKLPELERIGKKVFAPIPESLRTPHKYPEYPLSVVDYAKSRKVAFDSAPGACKTADMPNDVQKWLAEVRTKLRTTDSGKRRLKELDDAEGHWPDFPRKVLEIVREYRLPIPGLSSPTWRLPESLTGRPSVRK